MVHFTSSLWLGWYNIDHPQRYSQPHEYTTFHLGDLIIYNTVRNRTCQIHKFFGAGMMPRSPALQNCIQIYCKSMGTHIIYFLKIWINISMFAVCLFTFSCITSFRYLSILCNAVIAFYNYVTRYLIGINQGLI